MRYFCETNNNFNSISYCWLPAGYLSHDCTHLVGDLGSLTWHSDWFPPNHVEVSSAAAAAAATTPTGGNGGLCKSFHCCCHRSRCGEKCHEEPWQRKCVHIICGWPSLLVWERQANPYVRLLVVGYLFVFLQLVCFTLLYNFGQV